MPQSDIIRDPACETLINDIDLKLAAPHQQQRRGLRRQRPPAAGCVQQRHNRLPPTQRVFEHRQRIPVETPAGGRLRHLRLDLR